MTRLTQRHVRLCALAAAVLLAGLPRALPADEKAPLPVLEEQALKQAAAFVGPSVVRILTTGGQDRVGRVLTGTGPTTGVVVSPDGYIISSAFNFASRPSSVLVELPDGRRFPARLIATDRARMLTLLKIDAENLTPAPAADKESVRVGQWAVALGRTFDNPQPSISVGIVSALKRIWGRAIQTDAKVSPTNYGGPLVNIEGKVIGILVPLALDGSNATAGVEWYDSGIGFAIPMEDVYAVLERLKSGEDLKPGLMGITMQGRDFLAGEPVINFVRAGSPAEKAGFRPKDEIIEIDGTPIRRQAEVKLALGNKYAGETVTVTVRRQEEKEEEETYTAEVTLVDELLAFESGFLGVLPEREPAAGPVAPGVGLRWVYPESPAEEAGLQFHDRITRFNETDVADSAALAEVVRRVRPGQSAKITFLRDNEEQSAEVTLGSIPNSVPEELRSFLIPPPLDDLEAPKKEKPETGRITVEMESHEHSYWAYIPEDYNPEYEYGLMVWIHPNGDTMEAEILEKWTLSCRQRGILLLAPKAEKTAAWNMNEAGFVRDAVEHFRERYSIDPRRVFLHGFREGGPFTFHLAFKYRDLFHGAAVINSTMPAKPPENHPDYPLQIHLASGSATREHPAVRSLVEALRGMKYPVSFTALEEAGEEYPDGEVLLEIGRWADTLDRF